jgi:hypothetical protein
MCFLLSVAWVYMQHAEVSWREEEGRQLRWAFSMECRRPAGLLQSGACLISARHRRGAQNGSRCDQVIRFSNEKERKEYFSEALLEFRGEESLLGCN